MSWFDLTGLCFGFGISLLASACTLGTGLAGVSRFRVCQLSWNLAVLQFALLVAGWLLGVEATHHVGVWVVWADMVFVFLVAIRMFSMGKRSHVPKETSGVDQTIMLLGMTSSARILVLAWGFVLASVTIHQGSIGLLAGMLAFMLTGVGILSGYRFGMQVPRGPKWAGACALLLIAAHMQASLLLHSQAEGDALSRYRAASVPVRRHVTTFASACTKQRSPVLSSLPTRSVRTAAALSLP